MLDIVKIQNDFPILKRLINGKRLVYLDNAATSQKPQAMLDAMNDFYVSHNANVHRGIHTLSEEATKMYEDARLKVAGFINARYPEEIIFTKGTTDSINMASVSWGMENLMPADFIAFTESEHHSNMVPWQELASELGAKLKVLKIDGEGFLDSVYKNDLEGVKILGISHVSNVLGAIQNIKEISKEAHLRGCLVLVDGAQAVPHMKVDVQSLGCDFYAFSGHKMLGPTGIGILYIKKEIHSQMGTYQFGGGMIKEVFLDHATYADIPTRFEAGTPNIAGVIGLASAIDYLNSVGLEEIRNHELDLLGYALDKLSKVPDLKIYGPMDPKKRTGVVSFTLGNLHAHDVASVLDTEGVAIRSGHHCTMPLHHKLSVPSTARASFYLYNTVEDIDVLVKGLDKAVRILKR